jgi:glucosamine-6-phosphate deaminase
LALARRARDHGSVRLRPASTAEDAARRAADRLAACLERDAHAVVLLPAGRTPIALYDELARRAAAGALDPSGARFAQLDELVGVAPSDPRSFHAFLRLLLLDRIPRPPGADLLLDGAAADPAAEIARHARALRELGGASLALLGLGANGHVAFNEPGSPRDAAARVVTLAAETSRALAADFPEGVPRRGITLGLAELAAAREVCLVVTGASKAAVLAALLEGPPSPALPASLLLDHPRLEIVADAAARGRP